MVLKKSLPTDKHHLTEAFVQTLCLHHSYSMGYRQERASEGETKKKSKGVGDMWLHRHQQTMQNKALNLYIA